jgi:redox-sensitive bicupin YhaK (pirin superfamily)
MVIFPIALKIFSVGYMIYGILKPKEKGRLVMPGAGHEEIVLVVKGNLKVTGYYSGSVEEGSAFHIKDEQECFLENPSKIEAVYIIAGGHSKSGHH